MYVLAAAAAAALVLLRTTAALTQTAPQLTAAVLCRLETAAVAAARRVAAELREMRSLLSLRAVLRERKRPNCCPIRSV